MPASFHEIFTPLSGKFIELFGSGYRTMREVFSPLDEYPLSRRGCWAYFIEAQQPIVILVFPPYVTHTIETKVILRNRFIGEEACEQLKETIDPDEIAKLLGLGEIIDSREVPPSVLTGDLYSEDGLYLWASIWGSELANMHRLELSLDFDQAQQRMTSAYTKLFELEQTLRVLVQGQLERIHPTDWWGKVPTDVQNKVIKRECDSTAYWFDDFSPSRFKFADFNDLRNVVLANWQDFKTIIGDRDLFHSNMSYLSHARDRIAHVNTLSADDYQEFVTLAERLLRSIRPHVQLK